MKTTKLTLIIALLAMTFVGASAEKKADFWSVVKNRTSVRQWQDKAVPKSDIEDLLRAGMAAPTAVNKQPWRFLVLTEPAARKALAEKVDQGRMFSEAPVMIVVCGDMSAALGGEGRDYWIQDCSAATENILLAATAKGLGAVWTGAAPVQKRVENLQSALSLPQDIVPFNVILLGYPKDTPTPKDKWDPSKIHWEKW